MRMNRLGLLSALLSSSLMSGCVYSDASDPGDVTFSWSFAGANCAQERRIEQVLVTIPGEALENRGYYPCSINGYDGITLHDFAPGTYDFSLDAIDYDGYYSYRAVGTFTVDGNIVVNVDLTPTHY
ncbi:hypothetical protein [Melittangium boletus]|uniref:Ig-like domain-containing protein n=1 Tax=Melittangium boletus DSM 14713 TaxID=1294270 RepID=A0A250IFA2_9BACT|nr:hypothetical protein [Melittangium boletus]ATB29616.1 hypothetical protein MEBOL_003071 [Melittangium boletus DSM 14713]